MPLQVVRKGLQGPCQTREFGPYPESRGNMESLLPLGQMLDKGKTREWGGQATPRFVASLERDAPVWKWEGGGQGKVSGLPNLRHL